MRLFAAEIVHDRHNGKFRIPVEFVTELRRRESYGIQTLLGLGLAIRDVRSEFKPTRTALKCERIQEKHAT